MIEAQESTGDEMEIVNGRRASPRNLKAYVESVTSEDETPLTETSLERVNDMGSARIPYLL